VSRIAKPPAQARLRGLTLDVSRLWHGVDAPSFGDGGDDPEEAS
jgi:hypothetical protein